MKIITQSNTETQVHSLINPSASAYQVCPIILNKKDNLTFGMSINHKSGCCVEKVKTGRTDGCCAHIPNEKFIEHYRDTVKKETEITGVKPKLDPEVQAILDNKQVHTNLTSDMRTDPANTTKPQPAKSLTSKLKTVVATPIRFFKWLFIGFWKDIRLLLIRREE
jgi:hypothetical protein